MKVQILPGRASGSVRAPASKSYAHRYLIAAAMSRGESVLNGYTPCADTEATIACLSLLGIGIDRQGDCIRIAGGDLTAATPFATLPCGESGSTLRFLLPLAAMMQKPVTFSVSPQLMRRPMTVYEDLFAERQVYYRKTASEITVCGSLPAGEYRLPGNISSQFFSGLLFALSLAEGDSVLIPTEPPKSLPYIQMTAEALNRFGACIEMARGEIRIRKTECRKACSVTLEGDYSGAAPLFALNALGGQVTVENLNPNTLQGDRVCSNLLVALQREKICADLSQCPDLAPVLFAVAAAAHGGTFTGTGRLKIKESDRAAVMAEELAKFGAHVAVGEDFVTVEAANLHAPDCVLNSHGDHRVVMALAVLCSRTGGVIDGAEAVTKSYPTFFDDLSRLGIPVFTQ